MTHAVPARAIGVHGWSVRLRRRIARRAGPPWTRYLAPPLAASLVLATFSALLLYRSGAVLSIDRLLLLVGAAAVVLLSGQVVVEYVLPRAFLGGLVVATIAGYATTTSALLFGRFVCGAGVVTSFAVWSVLTVIGVVLRLRGRPPPARRLLDLELAVLAIPAAVVAFFCRDMAAAVPSLETTGVLPLWVDYFIHGAEIAQFGEPGPRLHGDILLTGVPLPLYHYGIFMLPALVQVAFDLPGLAAATAFLLPLGLLLACAGGVTLAIRLGGLWAGAIGFALLLVPATVHFGLGHPMFDFHWLMFTAPGTGYGLAIAAAALVLVMRAGVHNRAALIMASFLVLLLFQIRAHIFVLFVPPFLAVAWGAVPAIRTRGRAAGLAAAMAFVGALAILACWPHLRDVVISFSGAASFLESMGGDIDNRLGYGDLYRFISAWPQPLASIVRAALLVPLIFGPLLVLLATAARSGQGKPGLKRMDLLFLLLLGWQFVLLAFAPVGQNGDSSEYAHRPFPLAYLLAVVLTSAHAACALRLRAAIPPVSGARFTAAAAATALSAALMAAATGFDPALGRMSWAAASYRPVVDRGVVALSSELNRRVAPGERVAVGPVDPASKLIDKGVIVASLANRALYLATPALQTQLGGERGKEARRRLQLQSEAEKVLTKASHEAARYVADFAWYVDTRSAIEPADAAVFANSFGRIYRIKP